MGWDFSNHQIYSGPDPLGLRQRVLDEVDVILRGRGYEVVASWDDACRTIAIGPAQRWLSVYDSCGTIDDPDKPEFEILSRKLSALAPVVDIHMDDSAAIHFDLFRNEQVIDRYGNIFSVFPVWPSKEVEEAHRGRPEMWSDLMVGTYSEDDLLHAWKSSGATTILSRTAFVLGWDAELCQAGYTVDYDGIPTYYTEHFKGDPVDLSGFVEKYYWRED